jgi:hypothetical protein
MGAKRAPTTQTQVYRTVLRNTAAPARMNRFISRSGHQLVTSRESPTLDSSIYYWCSLEPYPAGSRAPSPSCAPCRGDGNDPGRHMAGPRVGDDSRAVVGRPRPSLHRPGWLRTPLRPHARPGQDRCWAPARAVCCLPWCRCASRRPGPRCSCLRRWRWSTVTAGGKGKETGSAARGGGTVGG